MSKSTTFKRIISLTGNIKFTGLELKEPMDVSAGMLGIKEALRHSVKEMGIMRSMRALLEMNQEKGFRQIAQWKGTIDLKSTPGSGIGKGRTVVNDHSFA